MENVKSLFHSRKFVISLMYLLVTILAAFVPQLADNIEVIAGGAALVSLGIAGLITIEDFGRAWAENRPLNRQGAIAAIVDELKRVFLGIAPTASAANAAKPQELDLTLGEDGVWELKIVAGKNASKERLTDQQLVARVEALTKRHVTVPAAETAAAPNG
jgi:hypothetical protein